MKEEIEPMKVLFGSIKAVLMLAGLICLQPSASVQAEACSHPLDKTGTHPTLIQRAGCRRPFVH